MTYTLRAQRLQLLAAMALRLHLEALLHGNRSRSNHFLKKRAWIMSMAIIDSNMQLQKGKAY